MTATLRLLGFGLAVALLLGNDARSAAAEQKAIEAAIKRGAAYLKKQVATIAPGAQPNYVGINALMGLAMLEAGVSVDDPDLKTVISRAREASYNQTQTYPIALDLLFLDRLGNPSDEPLIQMLGIRLLAGQTQQGGWGYSCIAVVPEEVVQRLRSGLKPQTNQLATGGEQSPPPAPKPSAKKSHFAKPIGGQLHADIVRYAATLVNSPSAVGGDDNSNTQFGIVGIWAARRHGVPVEDALTRLEVRFLKSQAPTGGWGYSIGDNASGAMTCAGLLGIATAITRREEKRLETAHSLPTKEKPKDNKPVDPFFVPPSEPGVAKGRKKPGQKPLAVDIWDVAAKRGLAVLAAYLGKRAGFADRGINAELYFLWSVERVGVVYDLQKIGDIDWYAQGADHILNLQLPDGSWNDQYGILVGTPFAILFLSKSNLTMNLRGRKDQEGMETELRAGGDIAPAPAKGPSAPVETSPKPAPAIEPLEVPPADESVAFAAELIRATADDWRAILEKHRDAKGASYTRGLMLAVKKLDGERKAEAREALAERLTRMTAATLREMLKSEEPELRRAAALACAMKDDSAHVPDLIEKLTDNSDLVRRAAKAGLKSLTGQDFGPAVSATEAERRKAAEKWKAWHEQKK